MRFAPLSVLLLCASARADYIRTLTFAASQSTCAGAPFSTTVTLAGCLPQASSGGGPSQPIYSRITCTSPSSYNTTTFSTSSCSPMGTPGAKATPLPIGCTSGYARTSFTTQECVVGTYTPPTSGVIFTRYFATNASCAGALGAAPLASMSIASSTCLANAQASSNPSATYFRAFCANASAISQTFSTRDCSGAALSSAAVPLAQCAAAGSTAPGPISQVSCPAGGATSPTPAPSPAAATVPWSAPVCPPATTPLTATSGFLNAVLQSPLGGGGSGTSTPAYQYLSLAANSATLYNPSAFSITVRCITNAAVISAANLPPPTFPPGTTGITIQSLGYAAFPSQPLPASLGCTQPAYPVSWLAVTKDARASYGFANFTSPASPFATQEAALASTLAIPPPVPSMQWTAVPAPGGMPALCTFGGPASGGPPAQIPRDMLGYGFVQPLTGGGAGPTPMPGYQGGDMVMFNNTGVWRYIGTSAPTASSSSSGGGSGLIMQGYSGLCLRAASRSSITGMQVLTFGGSSSQGTPVVAECWYLSPAGLSPGSNVFITITRGGGGSGTPGATACPASPAAGTPTFSLLLFNWATSVTAPAPSPTPTPAAPTPSPSPQPTPGASAFCPPIPIPSGGELAAELQGSSAALPHAFAADLGFEPTLISFTASATQPSGGLSYLSLTRGVAVTYCPTRLLRFAGTAAPTAFVIETQQSMTYGCARVNVFFCLLVQRAGASGLLASAMLNLTTMEGRPTGPTPVNATSCADLFPSDFAATPNALPDWFATPPLPPLPPPSPPF